MTATTVRPDAPQPAAQAPAPPAAPLQPPPSPIARDAHPAWTPPPEARPQPPRQQPPLPGRLVAAGQGPRRPPLPQPGFPNRPPRAPWPEPGERGNGARPPSANGSYAGAPPAGRERPGARPQQAPRSPPMPRGPGEREKGLLVESVPRRMRVGVPVAAEVRIARDRIEGLIATLNGRGAAPPGERPLMRALSVRLRAPGGGFWIEPATPETQWVDSVHGTNHDDYASWRWTVVARRRGRRGLALMVSARTVGRDGHTFEIDTARSGDRGEGRQQPPLGSGALGGLDRGATGRRRHRHLRRAALGGGGAGHHDGPRRVNRPRATSPSPCLRSGVIEGPTIPQKCEYPPFVLASVRSPSGYR